MDFEYLDSDQECQSEPQSLRFPLIVRRPLYTDDDDDINRLGLGDLLSEEEEAPAVVGPPGQSRGQPLNAEELDEAQDEITGDFE